MKANEAGLVKHAAMVNFERELQSIEQSASWRLTKPLRWLKSRLGRDPSRGGENRATITDEKAVSSPPSVDGAAPVPWSADQK